MDVELVLQSNLTSLLITERKFKDVVIGVPHHAPAGIEKLPCPEHQESDENAGFVGWRIANKLDCCSIIACNYRIDVNKYFRSDYSMQICQWNPKYLVEIHGHGGKRAKYNIEISSGNSSNNKFSCELASKLSEKCSGIENLKDLSICGDFDKIYFKAANSATIKDGRWVSFHIELPSVLRKPEGGNSGKPSSLGYEFCDYLVQSLVEICR